MAFDYPVNLDLGGRRCVLAGSGPLAVERLEGLLASRAEVLLVTPAPSDELRAAAAAAAAGDVVLHERELVEADLDDAFLAILTREDDHDVAALYAAAEQRGVLFAALDDVPHCMFGAMSQLRRGDLRVTISSAGRAPALAKRLRQRLEEELEDELAELVDVVDEAKRRHGPRQVPFDVWAGRWACALHDLDGLIALLVDGRREDALERIAVVLEDR